MVAGDMALTAGLLEYHVLNGTFPAKAFTTMMQYVLVFSFLLRMWGVGVETGRSNGEKRKGEC
jgi:hypothetical protein